MTHQAETLQTILPEKKNGAVSSVVVLPDDLEFETQNPNEKVFIMLRQHPFVNFGWIFITILMLLLPIGMLAVINALEIEIVLPEFVKQGYIFAGLVLWYVLLFTRSLMKFLEWYFNIYVVTNERIIDFDFNAFAYHKISEAGLESIVDATQETIGFLPMLFNYGDVYVQTAGERREFDFKAVGQPAWVRDKIMDLRDLVIKSAQ